MFILSGGEPLLRDDLEAIAAHASAAGGATVVVGTNGTRLTAERIASLQAAGVSGVAVSVDSLDGRYHDRFRHGGGALADTLAAVGRLREARLDFLVQTTVTPGNRDQLAALAAWAAGAGAVCFNVYFLVETGRGAGLRALTPAENDAGPRRAGGAGRALPRRDDGAVEVPAADHAPRLGARPRARRWRPTPPAARAASSTAGSPRRGRSPPAPTCRRWPATCAAQGFAEIWRRSPVFARLRGGELGGKCGRCEYRVVCGGCRARAYADTGDLLAADDSCAYQPSGDLPPRHGAGRRRGALRGADRDRPGLERRGPPAHRARPLLRPRRRRRPGRGLRPPPRPRRGHRRAARPRPLGDAGGFLPAPPLLLPPRR